MKRITVTGLLAGLALSISQSVLAEGRTDLEGPGDAVVIAGTGYEHTLFDSADNKCQHCHNDLYDTWKTSMHAKSWKDPIFQSKYQDFLRLQASKIGAVGPTGEYKEGTIQKTGQVCIKCHAPTAFYSNDYKITLTEVGDQNTDPDAFEDAKALQKNPTAAARHLVLLMTRSALRKVTGLTKAMALDGRKYDIATSQIDIGNAATDATERMAEGVPQANGTIAAEPRMDVEHVAQAVVYMANLPLDANVQFITVMATNMPYIGRG